MEAALLTGGDDDGEGSVEWKKLEEIKIEEIKAKIGFRFAEPETTECIWWKIGKNLAEIEKWDYVENGTILDFSIAYIRENLPQKVIFTQNIDEEITENLIQNGFYIDEDYGIFPVFNVGPDILFNEAESDGELKKIIGKILKCSKIHDENAKFGANLLQRQFETYFWRHCREETLFWGLRKVAAQTLLQRLAKPITVDSFNQANYLFSNPSVSDENTLKWESKLFSMIKGRLNALLNTQAFAETPQQYRQLFAGTCHEIAKLLIVDGKIKEALQILDEGIMKGIQFDDNNLAKLALQLSTRLPSLPPIEVCDASHPEPRPHVHSLPISVLIQPSLEDFLQYLEKPVVIKDFVKHFPIYEFFDFDYLNNVHGYRRVPIEFGSSYAGDDYSQKIVSIHEYLRDFLTSKDSPKAYLAQHALLDQLDLLESVPIPDYASLISSEVDPLVNVFIGPSGTISPLHFDPRPNFFCQIRGRKFVRLVNPKYSEDVYLNSDPMYANSTLADCEKPNLEEFPKLANIEMEDVVLEEGDCLFIPAKYFHLMRSLSPSISVSIWI